MFTRVNWQHRVDLNFTKESVPHFRSFPRPGADLAYRILSMQVSTAPLSVETLLSSTKMVTKSTAKTMTRERMLRWLQQPNSIHMQMSESNVRKKRLRDIISFD